MSLVALAALVPMLVGLPPGASAPAPGALPIGARVVALDQELGIVRVDLPRAELAGSIARLKAAPGTRYVEADAPLAIAGSNNACSRPSAGALGPSRNWWRTAIHLPPRSQMPDVSGVVVGIADTGADLERLGTDAKTRDFSGGANRADVTDEIGHGTLVTSLIAANRKSDLEIEGVAVGVPLAVARVGRRGPGNCGLASNLIGAFAWFRGDVLPSVVSVSIATKSTPALRESLRELQLGGTLVVAAAGNFGEGRVTSTFPWAEPGVLAVGSVKTSKKVALKSTRSPRIDLVAPGPGVPAIAARSARGSVDGTFTPDGTSFAAPIAAAAAALVRAKHPSWRPDEVVAALRQSARPLGPTVPDRAWGWGVLDVTAALRLSPKRDLLEPNDWAAAAAAQTALVHAGRASASVRARIGEGGDRRDLYPVALGGGQRLTATAKTGGARVQLSLLTKAGSALGEWSPAGATSSLSARAPSAGTYLVAVERLGGFGAYRLNVSRG